LHVEEVTEVVEDVDLHRHGHVVERPRDEHPEKVPVCLYTWQGGAWTSKGRDSEARGLAGVRDSGLGFGVQAWRRVD
jgi:hypothetical protein